MATKVATLLLKSDAASCICKRRSSCSEENQVLEQSYEEPDAHLDEGFHRQTPPIPVVPKRTAKDQNGHPTRSSHAQAHHLTGSRFLCHLKRILRCFTLLAMQVHTLHHCKAG